MTRRSLTEEARLLTLCQECIGSGTEDSVSQPMPTRPKGIEDAVLERGNVVGIRTDGYSVGCGNGLRKQSAAR